MIHTADFNSDGDIDGGDFLAWQRGFGTLAPNATKSDGDTNNDLDVDGDDLTEWEGQFRASIATVTYTATESAIEIQLDFHCRCSYEKQ